MTEGVPALTTDWKTALKNGVVTGFIPIHVLKTVVLFFYTNIFHKASMFSWGQKGAPGCLQAVG